jgi:hypothetical protein
MYPSDRETLVVRVLELMESKYPTETVSFRPLSSSGLQLGRPIWKAFHRSPVHRPRAPNVDKAAQSRSPTSDEGER